MISSELQPSILKSWGSFSKSWRSKGILTDPSANVVDQSVHSSVSTTLTPKVNIDTATTKAAASTTLDASSSVPEQGIYLLILYLMLTIYNYYNKKMK